MNPTRRLFKALLAEARIHDPTLKVRLRVGRSEEFPALRDYAYCASFGGKIEIVVAPKMSRASLERQAGVLAHELGHAILFHKRVNKHGPLLCVRPTAAALHKTWELSPTKPTQSIL
jgi:hypothetical protein